jgi:LmbE family N-acetylglucosaminyl deacetylase
VEVTYCVVTDGDGGGFDPSVPRIDIPAIRRAEQESSAALLGVRRVSWLGYPDGRVTVSFELRRDLSAAIRRARPQRLMCPSPERAWASVFASHPDHRATGEAALCAVYPDARNPFAHPELLAGGLEPHVVPEVWLVGGPSPDHFVDVTANFERKMSALLCHASQIADAGAIRERVTAWNGAVAAQAGLAEGRLAEAFQVVATG